MSDESPKQEPKIMQFLFILVSGIVPIITGPWYYFGTNEPLYLLLPFIGIAGILLSISKLKKRKQDQ